MLQSHINNNKEKKPKEYKCEYQTLKFKNSICVLSVLGTVGRAFVRLAEYTGKATAIP